MTALAPLGAWSLLRHLSAMNWSKLPDAHLNSLLNCQELQEVAIAPAVPAEELKAFHVACQGETLWYRGENLKGKFRGPAAFWEMVDNARNI